MEKDQIRKDALQKRDALSSKEVMEYSNQIINYLYQLPVYQEADIILLYASSGNEVNTKNIISNELQEKKREVYLPVVIDNKNNRMNFYGINSNTKYKCSFHSIMEPVDGLQFMNDENPYQISKEIRNKKIVMIMPGVAFDMHGNRLGYGRGFYDRFLQQCLQQNVSIYKIALSYETQLYDIIQHEKQDILYDCIITEKKYHEINHM